MLLLLAASSPVVAATFTVDATYDARDADPTDGVCDDGTGACTLRAALDEANVHDRQHHTILLPDAVYCVARRLEVTNPVGVEILGVAPGGVPSALSGGNRSPLMEVWESPACTAGPSWEGILKVRTGGVLTVENLEIRDGDSYLEGGAGVFLEENAQFTALGTTFRLNFTENNRGAGILGEAGSVVYVQGCLFDRNYTWPRGGAGLYLTGGGEATVLDSEFANGYSGQKGTAVSTWRRSSLWMDNVWIHDNTAAYGGGALHVHEAYAHVSRTVIERNLGRLFGGGLYVRHYAVVEVVDSAVLDNTSNWVGGGAMLTDGANLVLENVTLAGNHAEFQGGAAWVEGSYLSASSTTVVDNTALDATGGVMVVPTAALAGGASFRSSILAGNALTAGTPADCDPFAVTSLGHNAVGSDDATCAAVFAEPTDLATWPVADLGLGPVQDNGGAVPTVALATVGGLPSPAIDVGTCAAPYLSDADGDGVADAVLAEDARGFPRHGPCDAGAYEAP